MYMLQFKTPRKPKKGQYSFKIWENIGTEKLMITTAT